MKTAIFVCGCVIGLLQLYYYTGPGFGSGSEMAAVARSLARTGAYGNPFAPLDTGPTALAPPLYPLFLAALWKLFGGDAGMNFGAAFVSIALNASIGLLLVRLAAKILGDATAGVAAALLWFVSMRLMPQWDTSFTMAGTLVFCLAAARAAERKSGAAGAIATGALGGLLLLANPSLAIVLAAWLVFVLVRARTGWASALRFAAIWCLTAAMCTLPWLARNYRVWGSPLLRTSFGITLYSSNNDCAEPSLFQEMNSGCFQKTHPSFSEREAGLLARLGEPRYDSLKASEGMQWIRAHPARFASLCAARVRDFWFPDPTPSPYTCYAIWAVTILSIPGIVRMIRRRTAAGWFVLAAWVAYPALYYIMLSCDRYRYPILWTSLLPAGSLLADLARRAGWGWPPASSRPGGAESGRL